MKRIQLASAFAVAAALTMTSCENNQEIEFSEAGTITDQVQKPVLRIVIENK